VECGMRNRKELGSWNVECGIEKNWEVGMWKAELKKGLNLILIF
jgi:hypothetical protein